MNNDTIEKFVASHKRKNRQINIYFKSRSPVKGIFLTDGDYPELKSKNFWRIVTESRCGEWIKTKDPSLSRLFNGTEFTRLTDDLS